MKKLFFTLIIFTACVALCTAVWPQSSEDGKVPIDPVKPAVSAEIEAKPEETPSIILSADNIVHEPEADAESEAQKTNIATIKEKQSRTHLLSLNHSQHLHPHNHHPNQSQGQRLSSMASRVYGFPALAGLRITEAGTLGFPSMVKATSINKSESWAAQRLEAPVMS